MTEPAPTPEKYRDWLLDERDRLKAEVARLTAAVSEIGAAHIAAQAEVARLAVERDWLRRQHKNIIGWIALRRHQPNRDLLAFLSTASEVALAGPHPAHGKPFVTVHYTVFYADRDAPQPPAPPRTDAH